MMTLPPFFALRHVTEIDSTNEEAKRRAAAGAATGLVIWADRQSAGRGRRGRAWQSPSGNLYCSILLRPDKPAIEVAQLSFAAALAVCEALPAVLALRCKWPNDVLIAGKKVAGILLESEAAGGNVGALIIGFGINLESHPEGTETPATSLAAVGIRTTPGAVLADLCRHFLTWYQTWHDRGFAPLREAWLGRARALGSEIRVRYGAYEMRGRFVDLDASGALVLETSEGRRRISAGDVFATA
jgi:BirA family transcriptional regulator, biotin operon repressor / biotin---[acetyl-CoA-carboxylase] ligase